ncbi:MAG: LytTR family DNA-binding domain-containing protein [Spirochaetaceae bacterium]|nr:LytTR family DNA-binding domain-containing protein [Spirochaetaceae bacterium]
MNSKDAASGMRFAHREMLKPEVALLVVGIIAYFLLQSAVSGSTYADAAMGWGQRLGYSGLVALLQSPISYACCVLTLYVVRDQRPLVTALALLAMVLVLGATCTAIVLAVFEAVPGAPARNLRLDRIYGACVFYLLSATSLVYYVLWVRLNRRTGAEEAEGAAAAHVAEVPEEGPRTITTPHSGRPSPTAEVPATVSEDSGRHAVVKESRFFDRLPDELGRDIIYLSAAAHYVDVVTAAGSASILLRFSDAVAELGDLGMRVHRSYWAAYAHVKRAVRRDGRTLLLLTDDHEVRVGRNYLAEVRAAVPKAWVRARRRRTTETRPDAEASLHD